MTQTVSIEKQKIEWFSTGKVAALTGESAASIRRWIPHLPPGSHRRTRGGEYRLTREAVEIILRNNEKRAI